MNLQLIANIALPVLLIGWIGYRQTTWRALVPGRMWRMPIVMAVIGAGLLITSGQTMNGLDVAVLVVELVISLGVGAWMGAIARLRKLEQPFPVGDEGSIAEYESRTGWWGLLLWLIVIGVRIGIDVFAVGLGAHSAVSAGVIVLLLAANRIARVAVLSMRLDRRVAVTA